MDYDDDLTAEEWKEFLSHRKKTMEQINQNVRKSFESRQINSFSYKSCSMNEEEKIPKKVTFKSFNA
ncbi:hypothetical protein [Methanosarcina mazei]|jgi:hypothetical protein|uniref:Uncharacterized protein n=1 Tax=Methanosarcina mazei LYC TaxID=1434114 RepID=A0A0E3RL98_METMZ|nr:hypothetical protein [Methanosarcina mazei]AKB67395.1 hypothetical protein MSMAL_0852 [Methanosarcina mazei LYC]